VDWSCKYSPTCRQLCPRTVCCHDPLDHSPSNTTLYTLAFIRSHFTRSNTTLTARCALALEQRHARVRTGQALIECKANVECFELRCLHPLCDTIVTSDLFVGHGGNVDRARECFSALFQAVQGLNVLYSNTLHVLSTTRVNIALFVLVRGERINFPPFLRGLDPTLFLPAILPRKMGPRPYD
jgi:hypothetical protein